MKRTSTALICVLGAASLYANTVEVAPAAGRVMSSIHWQDELGRRRELSEFSGYPLILLPIYTRCPGPCLRNVEQLKQGLADSTANPRQFRVLLFSFDPSDDAETLVKYRQRENIPLAWSIGSSSQAEIERLLDSIGVQIAKAGNEFAHPNIVLFLDPKLRIVKWIYGTAYSAGDVDHALNVAGGESDWVAQHGQLLYSLLLVTASGLCVALTYYLGKIFSRRSGSDHSAVARLSLDR